MIEKVKAFDQALFIWLNSLNTPWLDPVMASISHKFFWIPVYVLLVLFIFRFYGWKMTLLSLLAIAVLITLADRGSVVLFKDVFQRYRPCHNLTLQPIVHIVNGKCGGLYGFISSHASNHFALSVFLTLLFKTSKPHLGKWLLLWAALVSYSRVYLGVHYPADILAGALYGSSLAFLIYASFSQIVNKLSLDP